MGYSTSAYAFYGVHIPRELWTEGHVAAEADVVQAVLAANRETLPDVGYLMAGDYDRDMLFLTAGVASDESVEVELGSFRRYEAVNSHRLMKLTGQLNKAAQLLGYDVLELDPPAYIVVPDYS